MRVWFRSEIRAVALPVLATLLAMPAFAQAFVLEDGVTEFFSTDPTARAEVVIVGDALERVTWNPDPAAFPGDLPGSLTARCDSDLPAGLFGFSLPRTWTEQDAFTAAAVFVIETDRFQPNPFGFFQISWGLWNSSTTGLDRTGSLENFASDSFELLEVDYYPNVSPFFGGPFVAPSLFGVADPDDPAFEFLGAFANASLVFDVEVALPVGRPLLAWLQHRPGDGVVVVSVFSITDGGTPLPVPGAVAVLPIGALKSRAYALDTVGLTLWNDGFGGETAALRADVTYHALLALPGILGVDDLARIAPATWR